MTTNADIAERFVDLVLSRNWSEAVSHSEDDDRVIFDTLNAAGFVYNSIVLDRLYGNYRDQDGTTGEKFPINVLCPFTVGSEGKANYFATGWLDCAFRLVHNGKNEGRDNLAKKVAAEIERSVPLEPIQMTADGDMFGEYPPDALAFGLGYFVSHKRDGDALGSCTVGIHIFCNGYMERRDATKSHDAILCRGCGLRVLFPRDVRTLGELRQALAARLAQQ